VIRGASLSYRFIFNLLPIAVPDGGVILLLLVEMVVRHDLGLAVEEAVFKPRMLPAG
jgi:membrane-associated protease RseP (regulator of RpoE activity)